MAEPWKDVFASLLADFGFDSFMDGETDNILLCYAKKEQFDAEKVHELLKNSDFPVAVDYQIAEVENQNWNALWESNYAPVLIEERCYIRAPFHEARPASEYEIVIEPKMSFGTAHHETTSLMIAHLLDEPLTGKRVLDMGAGTGVLAILAHKKGAQRIVAIDNDEWAYENNIENNERNDATEIEVRLGEAPAIGDDTFDVIIANINRNVLVNDIPAYAKALNINGILFLSGFYQGEDLDIIKAKCAENGLQFVSVKEKNNWVAAKFKLEN